MIPLFELVMNEDAGVSCISLVGSPAMEEMWVKLSKEEVKFETLSTQKKILFGAILIPNKPILRLTEEGEPYYVVFSKNTIEEIRNKYFKEKQTHSLNAEHSPIKIDGYMVESFIKDTARGILPPVNFSHLPDGTWFGSIKVEDDPIWNRFVETGRFTGFSIEGNFKPVQVMDMDILDKFDKFLDQINTKRIKQTL